VIAALPGAPFAAREQSRNGWHKLHIPATWDKLFFVVWRPGKEANWVPTDPKRGFELMFRAYAPTKAFFEKEWKLPDAEKLN
jgi:hypothetical protein